MKTLLKTILMSAAICAISASAAAQNTQATGSYSGSISGSMAANRTLSSADVRLLQQELASRGYYTGSVDGIWGPLTTSAIQQYQSSLGLPTTGTLTTSMLNDLGVRVTTDTQGLGDISPAAGDDVWDDDTLNSDMNMDTDTNMDMDMDMDSVTP